MDPSAGDHFEDRYLLRREIARSERRLVFEARHIHTMRTVAIKLVRPRYAADEQECDALMSEARLLAEVRHPCIVEVLDGGHRKTDWARTPGAPYLVMEMLEGRSLGGVLTARRTLSVVEALRIGLGLCRGLATIHRSGIVHGNLTPENVMLAPTRLSEREWDSGESDAKLISFGHAVRSLTGAPRPRGELPAHIEYGAPEQAGGGEAEPVSDIYSLGVLLYECLTGQLPHGRELTPANIIRSEVPGNISDALTRALRRDPAERHTDARALAEALWKTKTTHKPKPPPPTQRRVAQRACYVTPVQVQRSGDRVLKGRCEDLSVAGMMVLLQEPLENGESVRMRFSLPVSGRTAAADGVARWSKEARGACVVGIQFTKVDTSTRDTIARYVALFGEQSADAEPT